MITLRNKELDKLAIVLNVPILQLEKMAAIDLIDKSVAIDTLIRYDCQRLKRRRYVLRHIVTALAQEYDVTESRVRRAMNGAMLKTHYCPKCGRKTSKAILAANRNLCDRCAVQQVPV